MKFNNNDENTKEITHLLEEAQTISESFKRVAEITGENFNIFKILKVERREVRTHSAFIAELLNTKGTHSLGDLFLNQFINQQLEKFEDTKDQNPSFYNRIKHFVIPESEAKAEHYIGSISEDVTEGGRIDIILKDKNLKNFIIIENKIDAQDQSGQLVRYKNAYKESPIFYLTLKKGDKPNDDSKGKLKEGEDFICISYEIDILDWLNACLEKAHSRPIIRESLNQYIYLLRNITNQNSNIKMSEKIAQKVLETPSKFESYVNLYYSFEEIRRTILNENVFNLLEEIAKENELELSIKKEEEFRNFSGQYVGFYYKNDILKKLNLSLHFWFESPLGLKNFTFGFAYIDIDCKVNPQYEKIKEDFKNSFNGKTKYTNSRLCEISYEDYQNWHDMGTLHNIRFGNFKKI
jgi:hypothetical protein